MLPVWRVTRTPYGRAVYETLERVGITATRMYEYVAPTDVATDRTADATLGVFAPRDPGLDAFTEAYAAFDELRDDEHVVAATVDGEPVGYLFVSADATLHVHPLDEDLSFDGAYVRRVFVDPEYRKRGIATALVARALDLARTELDADRATALVAQDNRPSQWVFEANGFRRRRVHSYARVFGWTRRRTTSVA
jgi:GNAT superfamily N-acetyltransferase